MRQKSKTFMGSGKSGQCLANSSKSLCDGTPRGFTYPAWRACVQAEAVVVRKSFPKFFDHGCKCFYLFTYFCRVSINISQKLFLQGTLWEILARI